MPSDDSLWTRDANIIHLGSLIQGLPDEDEALFLNLGEMYFALMLQSLQGDDLDHWLPVDTPREETNRGLNVALPLHQSFADMAKRGMAKLLQSTDPEVRAYALSVLANNRAKIIADNYRQNIITLRKIGKWAHLFRDVVDRGQEIDVYCVGCGTHYTDHWPRYVLRTGEYLCRLLKCEHCPLSKKDRNDGSTSASVRMDPVDSSIPLIPMRTFYSRLQRPSDREHWKQFYSFECEESPENKRGISLNR